MVQIERVGDADDALGESPVWCDREQALYWVDIRAPALRRYGYRTRLTTTWPLTALTGFVALRQAGGLIVGQGATLGTFDIQYGKFVPFAAAETEFVDHRFNDARVDRRGRLWAGTMNDVAKGPVGGLYRVDAQRRCVKQAAGISVPNGLAWSLDDRTLYFADSALHTIFAYPFDPAAGTIGPRKPFASCEEAAGPDGATVDEEGLLWCAIYNGWRLERYAPDGRIDRAVKLPVQYPTSCSFGAPNRDILYVTTATQGLSAEELAKQPLAGKVLALDVGVRGLAEPRYRG
jgi:L-arabinonolactonase